jgi:hydroxymethylglutaryl-CoA reductase
MSIITAAKIEAILKACEKLKEENQLLSHAASAEANEHDSVRKRFNEALALLRECREDLVSRYEPPVSLIEKLDKFLEGEK